MALSRTQVDRLGERLKTQHESDNDLSELDAYRRSFTAAYDKARSAACKFSRLEVTGREKSNASIIEKLRRQPVRLSQIQDIVGSRIVVEDTEQQSRVVHGVANLLHESRVVNRLAEARPEQRDGNKDGARHKDADRALAAEQDGKDRGGQQHHRGHL